MKRLLVTLFLFIFASSAIAAELGKRGKKEYMGACGEADAGIIYAMTNGSNAASCDAAQAVGALRIYCSCTPDGMGGYAWGLLDTALGGEAVDLTPYALDTDLANYVLLAGDADGQTIQGTTGSQQARIAIGVTPDQISLYGGGGGATGTIDVTATGVYLASGNGSSWLWLSNGQVLQLQAEVALEVQSPSIRMRSQFTPPTNANDACSQGETLDTATFHYYCAATNTWVRVAMATWP